METKKDALVDAIIAMQSCIEIGMLLDPVAKADELLRVLSPDAALKAVEVLTPQCECSDCS